MEAAAAAAVAREGKRRKQEWEREREKDRGEVEAVNNGGRRRFHSKDPRRVIKGTIKNVLVIKSRVNLTNVRPCLISLPRRVVFIAPAIGNLSKSNELPPSLSFYLLPPLFLYISLSLPLSSSAPLRVSLCLCLVTTTLAPLSPRT